MIKVGIIGATGYTGVELVRLLSTHSKVCLHAMTSRGDAGIKVGHYFRSLEGVTDLKFVTPDDPTLDECDVVFFATPHGVAMKDAMRFLERGAKVIDLSADFRLQDPAVFKRWYGIDHTAQDLLKSAVYGVPELYRDSIRNASLVANPGCYPTITQLGFAPFLKAGVIDPHSLIADCKSGVSGAGRKAELGLIYCEVAESFKAYGINGHRHHSEMVQELNKIVPSSLTFTPHLVPMNRGMFATLYAKLNTQMSLDDLQAILLSAYKNEPFIKVLGVNQQPESRSVKGSNNIQYSISLPETALNQLVILGAQDNLVKGSAGQAIQNMNIMCGFNENEGLKQIALIP